MVLGLAAQVLVVPAAVLDPRAKLKPRGRPSRSPLRASAIAVADRVACRRIATLPNMLMARCSVLWKREAERTAL